MEFKDKYLSIYQIKKKRKCKEIKFYYIIIMRKKLFFIIFLIMFEVNIYNSIEFTNLKKKK